MAEVVSHYDASAPTYSQQYDETAILTSSEYPANYFRLQKIKERVTALGIRSIFELGIGDGSPITAMGKMGLRVGGCDISQGMLKVAKAQFVANGLDPDLLAFGDIQDSETLKDAIATGPYDAVMALGVLPHVRSETDAVTNMSQFIEPGGTMFLQFRNSMLSLFSFNRYTMEFILDELLRDAPNEIKSLVEADLRGRLAMDKPPLRTGTTEAPGYDEILAKFHNPFELSALVESLGFKDLRFHWYNYHVTPPMLSSAAGSLFRTTGIEFEGSDNWRGMFMCSAGVIEATKV